MKTLTTQPYLGDRVRDALLKAIARGDGDSAEALVRLHLTQASGFMANRLQGKTAQTPSKPTR